MIKRKRKNPGYKWGKRRQMIDLTIYFCIFCILFIMFKGKDLEIYENILTNAFYLIAIVITVYVGGRTVQDIKAPHALNPPQLTIKSESEEEEPCNCQEEEE